MSGNVIIIRPGEEPTVESIELDGDGLRKAIGCEMLEMLPITYRVDAWFDEEGRLTSKAPNRLIPTARGEYDILGTIVIAATDGEGETIGMDAVDAELWRRKAAAWPRMVP